MKKLTAEAAAEKLQRRGMDVSEEQAVEILALLRKFANIIVCNHLEQHLKERKIKKPIILTDSIQLYENS